MAFLTLYRKELRSLLPIQVLLILSYSGDLLFRPFTERPDEATWLSISSYIEPGGGSEVSLMLLVFGLLVAYSLFPREHDEGTIELLYSLPVSRRTIFVAKALAGWTVLVVASVLLLCTDWLLQSQNPQTYLGQQWRADVAVAATFLQVAGTAIVLSHGLLISFLRRFGLIPYALAGWIIISAERVSPGLARLNFLHLFSLEYVGSAVVLPWGELGLHLAGAGLALGLAYALWMERAEGVRTLWGRLQERVAGKVVLGCGTVMVVIVFTCLLFVILEPGGVEEPGDGPRYVSFQVDRASTRSFDFTYPANLRQRAHLIINRAEELQAALHELLAAGAGERVVVDLTESSEQHAGIAGWTKIRVGLAAIEDEQRLLHTFAHELVHSVQAQESRRRLADNSRATRIFTEGSAEYLAFWLVPDREALAASRRIAVAAWQRLRIPFEVLADDDRLRVEHDPHLVYALGETWTAALADACGEQAVGEVLRAVGRDDAPQGLEPMAFWRDTLQAVGCGIEQVLSAWTRLMRARVEAEGEFLAALPRLGGGIAASDATEVTILATLDRPPLDPQEYPSLRYLVRVRDNQSTDDDQIRTVVGRDTGSDRQVEFAVPRHLLRGRRFQFQLGIEPDSRSWAYWEPWQTADVP